MPALRRAAIDGLFYPAAPTAPRRERAANRVVGDVSIAFEVPA